MPTLCPRGLAIGCTYDTEILLPNDRLDRIDKLDKPDGICHTATKSNLGSVMWTLDDLSLVRVRAVVGSIA